MEKEVLLALSVDYNGMRYYYYTTDRKTIQKKVTRIKD